MMPLDILHFPLDFVLAAALVVSSFFFLGVFVLSAGILLNIFLLGMI